MKRTLKQRIKSFDNDYFDGKIKKIYKKIRRIGAEPFYNIEGYLYRKYRDGKVLFNGEVALKDIILSQYHNDDYDNYRFVNGVVELLAIENYFLKNEYGFDYYRRMQDGNYFDWESRFKKLIESFDKNGYEKKHFVQLAKDFAVMDGSHRIMLAWYNNLEFINGKVYQTERDRPFNIDFFWEKGFDLSECEIIKKKRDAILEEANYLYTGVIWPPAVKYADKILEDIENHGDGVRVVEKEMIEYTRDDFIGLFKGLYHTDILDEEGMEYKIGLIEKAMDSKIDYTIVRFKLRCDNPRMTMNPKNYMPQSETISRIKQWVRRRYKANIKNYEYDVIMHISDNYLQSKFCQNLFMIDKNLSELFDGIKKYDYAVMRMPDVENINKSFPYYYDYRANCNMLVRDSQKQELIKDIEMYCRKKCSLDWMSVKKAEENGYVCIKIMLRDFMIFQVEVTDSLEGISRDFIDTSLANIDKNGQVNVLSREHEAVVRLLAYIENPNKKRHLDYLNKNRSIIKDFIFEGIFDRKYQKKAMKVINNLEVKIENEK